MPRCSGVSWPALSIVNALSTCARPSSAKLSLRHGSAVVLARIAMAAPP